MARKLKSIHTYAAHTGKLFYPPPPTPFLTFFLYFTPPTFSRLPISQPILNPSNFNRFQTIQEVKNNVPHVLKIPAFPQNSTHFPHQNLIKYFALQILVTSRGALFNTPLIPIFLTFHTLHYSFHKCNRYFTS